MHRWDARTVILELFWKWLATHSLYPFAAMTPKGKLTEKTRVRVKSEEAWGSGSWTSWLLWGQVRGRREDRQNFETGLSIGISGLWEHRQTEGWVGPNYTPVPEGLFAPLALLRLHARRDPPFSVETKGRTRPAVSWLLTNTERREGWKKQLEGFLPALICSRNTSWHRQRQRSHI